jgi:1,4-alpha-glucan branching enzyme
MNIPVLFTYYTGIPVDALSNVRQAVLRGSWGGDGRYSDSWTSTEMRRTDRGEDGCLQFNGEIELDSTQIGREFHWGVAFTLRDGSEEWAIPTEVRDRVSTQRYRTFQFSAAVPTIRR